jgi:hypothetical protein
MSWLQKLIDRIKLQTTRTHMESKYNDIVMVTGKK